MILVTSLSLHHVNSVMVIKMPATGAANVKTSFVVSAGASMTKCVIQLKSQPQQWRQPEVH